MINELLFMNGYGAYVLSAFSFTLLSFGALYLVTKIQFTLKNKINLLLSLDPLTLRKLSLQNLKELIKKF